MFKVELPTDDHVALSSDNQKVNSIADIAAAAYLPSEGSKLKGNDSKVEGVPVLTLVSDSTGGVETVQEVEAQAKELRNLVDQASSPDAALKAFQSFMAKDGEKMWAAMEDANPSMGLDDLASALNNQFAGSDYQFVAETNRDLFGPMQDAVGQIVMESKTNPGIHSSFEVGQP